MGIIVLLGVLAVWTGPATAPAGGAAPQPEPAAVLEAPCPVDWRGVRLVDALPELAGRLGVPYILDASVDAAALEASVRMSAVHLTGVQAFRWLVRSGGLEAALVEGTFLVAAPQRLPLVWRGAGGGGRGRGRPSDADQRRWQSAREKRADVKWIDIPLSGLAAEVAGAFGIDVIFHPEVLANQGLVCFEGSQAGLDSVCRALAEQTGAGVDFVDGALWVHPGSGAPAPPGDLASMPATGPAAPRWGGVASQPLDRRVAVDRTVATWPAMVSHLAGLAGCRSRLEAPPGVLCPAIEAEGTLGEVLEAARLLGTLSWTWEPGDPEGPPILAVQIHRKP